MSFQSGFVPLVVTVGVLLYKCVILFFFLTYSHQKSSTPSIAETETQENNTSETKSNLDTNHPGALKSPMVGTAHVSP